MLILSIFHFFFQSCSSLKSIPTINAMQLNANIIQKTPVYSIEGYANLYNKYPPIFDKPITKKIPP